MSAQIGKARSDERFQNQDGGTVYWSTPRATLKGRPTQSGALRGSIRVTMGREVKVYPFVIPADRATPEVKALIEGLQGETRTVAIQAFKGWAYHGEPHPETGAVEVYSEAFGGTLPLGERGRNFTRRATGEEVSQVEEVRVVLDYVVLDDEEGTVIPCRRRRDDLEAASTGTPTEGEEIAEIAL